MPTAQSVRSRQEWQLFFSFMVPLGWCLMRVFL